MASGGPISQPADQDVLALGRSLSDGSVDIYDPGVPKFSVTEQQAITPRPDTVPENSGIIVRDPGVTVYSLDSAPMPLETDSTLAQVAPAAAPPSQYAPELTPQPGPRGTLPNLQPPIAAQGQHASPFTPDGYFVK